MQFEDRAAVVRWLNGHAGQRICLRRRGTRLRVTGSTGGVDELDACSTEILQSEWNTALPGVQLALSLHPAALSLHLLGTAPGGELVCSLPVHVPYNELILTREGERAGDARDEPDFSPYELLFRGTD